MSRFIYFYAERHYAECHYAECCYAECRGASERTGFLNLFVNVLESFTLYKFFSHLSRGQSYKTFYVRNLQIFIISQGVCPR